jgi:hypothetical protein
MLPGSDGESTFMDLPSLRDVIRRKLDDSTLPSDGPPGTINAGHGSGKTCDACGDPIEPTQVEYEMNYPQERRTFRFHLGCAGLWEAGRLKGGLDPAL